MYTEKDWAKPRIVSSKYNDTVTLVECNLDRLGQSPLLFGGPVPCDQLQF